MTIASLTGVGRADAGVASGLINTSRQIGGAIGIAAASAIAATAASTYADAHRGITATSPIAVDQGLQTAFYALTAVLVAGAILAATFVRPTRVSQPVAAEEPRVAIEEAA